MREYEVETVSVDGRTTALGSAGAFTLVVDRPTNAGGSGQGFSGGQLLNLAVAGCVSNDLFREASRAGITLRRVRVAASSDYQGDPPVSTPIGYEVELEGNAPREALLELVERVDGIAEIPNSIRNGTGVNLTAVRAVGPDAQGS